jgi:hypothetical protein
MSGMTHILDASMEIETPPDYLKKGMLVQIQGMKTFIHAYMLTC